MKLTARSSKSAKITAGNTSYLKDNAIKVPDGVEYVWFRTKVRKQTYSYEYSFDGVTFTEIPVQLDAAVLSDDYVLQSYGGFFTGAFVGLAAVDYAGYGTRLSFISSSIRNWAIG